MVTSAFAGRRLVDVPLGRQVGAVDDPAGGQVDQQPQLLGLGPGQRRGRAGGVAVAEADRGGGRVGAERRRGQVGVLPGLLGHQPDTRRGVEHEAELGARQRGVAGGQRRLGALTGEHRPEVTGAGVRGRPRLAVPRAVGGVGREAVAVPVLAAGRGGAVAVVAGAGRRGRAELLVEHRQRVLHVGVVRGQLAEPDQLLEAAVDDGALVDVDAAVAEAVEVSAFGSPFLESRMKYGEELYGPLW